MVDELLRSAEVARLLGVSRSSIYRWATQRRLTYLRIGRTIRIPRGAIEELLRRATVEAQLEHN